MNDGWTNIKKEVVNPNVYSKEQWNKVRVVVKTQHMKHYPKDFVTDMEADRILAAMSPQAVEKLYELAVKYGISQL
jgi:NAD(P)H-flavin reductase